jgi:hypothetical protein
MKKYRQSTVMERDRKQARGLKARTENVWQQLS